MMVDSARVGRGALKPMPTRSPHALWAGGPAPMEVDAGEGTEPKMDWLTAGIQGSRRDDDNRDRQREDRFGSVAWQLAVRPLGVLRRGGNVLRGPLLGSWRTLL